MCGSGPVAAGLMFGPALLGLIADFTSVQTALVANAAVLAAAVTYFALTAREARHLRLPRLPKLPVSGRQPRRAPA